MTGAELEDAIVTHLKADNAVKAIISDRVYRVVMPRTGILPSIIIAPVDKPGTDGIPIAQYRFRLSCRVQDSQLVDGYKSSDALAKAVISSLESWKGDLEGMGIEWINHITTLYAMEQGETDFAIHCNHVHINVKWRTT